MVGRSTSNPRLKAVAEPQTGELVDISPIMTSLAELKMSNQHIEETSRDTKKKVEDVEKKLRDVELKATTIETQVKKLDQMETRLHTVEQKTALVKGAWVAMMVLSLIIGMVGTSVGIVSNYKKMSEKTASVQEQGN